MKVKDKQSKSGVTSHCRWGLLATPLIVAIAINACSSGDTVVLQPPEALSPQAEVQGTGQLRVALVTEQQARYRLRSAIFDVTSRSGLRAATLDTASDLNATELTVDLNQGAYLIELRDGWVLEQLAANGSATAVRAALISPNPSNFSIRNDRETNVVFSFTTDAGVVTFGRGTLNVSIAFANPATLAECDIVFQSGCGAGQTCLLADAEGRTFCASSGSIPVGASCDSEQCTTGSQCLSLDPAAPDEGVCTQFCNPLSPPFGCACTGLSFDDDIGVCGPPPPGTCDLLTQTGCESGEACQFPAGSFGVCGIPGSVGEGRPCFGEVCQAGLDCYGDDPQFGSSGTCYPFCDLRNPGGGGPGVDAGGGSGGQDAGAPARSCQFCFDVGTGFVGRCFF